jgi:hypothetical protein
VSKSQIDIQAQKHRDTASSVESNLNQLLTDVDTVLANSKSNATKALKSVCEEWVGSMKNNAISHLNLMAENIAREANNQEGTDLEATNVILATPMETGAFLGA